MIYTSYYQGTVKGEGVSISLYPPKGFVGKHLPLFAPAAELLNWWKSSKQDVDDQKEYAQRFSESLQGKLQFVDVWLKKQSKDNDITLLCYEGEGKFCHRHLVGQIVNERSPELWGGEVSQCLTQSRPLPPALRSLSERSGIRCDRLSDDLYLIEGETYMEYGALALLSRKIYTRKHPVRVKKEIQSVQDWEKWLDTWLKQEAA
jgi:uncharacterized protein YeaO (DUF488 family)